MPRFKVRLEVCDVGGRKRPADDLLHFSLVKVDARSKDTMPPSCHRGGGLRQGWIRVGLNLEHGSVLPKHERIPKFGSF